MRAEYPDDGDLVIAFAGEADVVQDAAGPADEDWVHERLAALLSWPDTCNAQRQHQSYRKTSP